MKTAAQKIAQALNVTEIDATRSATHTAMRHAEILRQSDVIQALADRTGLDLEAIADTLTNVDA